MNRLADAASPYLRQHRDNPVDWYQWGDEAFTDALGDANVPIMLSVGYSACHWCHVMAHESFEDDATAAVLNDLFVNIKVDREERPDVDAIYMEATQALTGHGGWPMTVFCTPDGRPFHCGTYFPKTARGGMPGFVDVCRAVDDAWRNNRDDLFEHADSLTQALGRSAVIAVDGDSEPPGADALRASYSALRQQHDDEWGGFGSAPKFPQTQNIELLLRAYLRNQSPVTLATVQTTLDAMASGGIYDHLGGGFARYSVDNIWLVPHFEKMLYDQALLARVYLHAWQITGQDTYRQVLDEIIAYVLRDLRHPSGGFYSAEDADSEGEEGLFYVWSSEQVRAAGADAALDWYGVTDEGNFEGRTILNRIVHRGELLRPPDVEAARQTLFDEREKRVRPGLDDKVLTEWNALMLATLAEAAAATGNTEWRDAAVANGDFLLAHLRRDDGRWLRAWQADHGAHTLAFAADYGALVDAFTRVAELTGEARWIEAARETAHEMLDLFWDAEGGGGLFTTGRDGEQLVARAKDILDGATPAANSLAAVGLLRLGVLTADELISDRADEILRLLGPMASRHPTAFGHLLLAADTLASGATEIVITGDRHDMVEAVQHLFLPNAVLAWGERYDSPLWEGRGDGFAYVCRNYACDAPVDDPAALVDKLRA